MKHTVYEKSRKTKKTAVREETARRTERLLLSLSLTAALCLAVSLFCTLAPETSAALSGKLAEGAALVRGAGAFAVSLLRAEQPTQANNTTASLPRAGETPRAEGTARPDSAARTAGMDTNSAAMEDNSLAAAAGGLFSADAGYGGAAQAAAGSGHAESARAEALAQEKRRQLYGTDAVLETALGPMTYYSQEDPRWGTYLYGGSDPLSVYGCGPTAAAMVVNAFAPRQEAAAALAAYENASSADSSSWEPPVLAEWAAANGYYAPQSGSYHALIPDVLSACGLTVTSVADRSAAQAAALLSSGHILVALMGPGTFTDDGHFLLITGLREDGAVTIADPKSYAHTRQTWDLDELLGQLLPAYDSGGPLWAVGR